MSMLTCTCAHGHMYSVFFSVASPQALMFFITHASEEDEPDSPMVIRSWFFQYAPNTLWGTVGTVHYGFLDAYATKYSSCTVNPVSEGMRLIGSF